MTLTESSVEKDVKFAGVVRDLPVGLDPANRTELMRVIDLGKKEKRLSWATKGELWATLYINIHNIKICARADKEDLLLRIPIPQVAAISYIRDDDIHILAIIFGEMDVQKRRPTEVEAQCCHLAVLYCDSRGLAEEICSLVDQCFQTVYTEATMHFFDRTLMEGAGAQASGGGDFGSDLSESSTPPMLSHRFAAGTSDETLGFLSNSRTSLGQSTQSGGGGSAGTLSSASEGGGSGGAASGGGSGGGGVSGGARPKTPSSPRARSPRPLPSGGIRQPADSRGAAGVRVGGGGAKEGELSDAANQLIFDYMTKLYNKLTPDELQKFALLVKAWHADLTFSEFCEGVRDLYGPDRTHLLIGMRPFIPAKDSAYFERFIERIGGLRDQPSPTGSELDSFQSTERVPRRQSSKESSWRGSLAAPSLGSVGGASSHRGTEEMNDQYDMMLDDISHDIGELHVDRDSSS